MEIVKVIAKAVFAFFASDKTPNSSFYITAGTLVGTLATALSASGSPMFVAVGGILAAVYTVANNYTEARKTQAAAEAFNSTLRASIRMEPPSLTPLTHLTPEAASAVAQQVVATVKDAAAKEAE